MSNTKARNSEPAPQTRGRPPNVHDALFKAVFGNPEGIAALLVASVSWDILCKFDLAKLKPVAPEFIGKELRQYFGDLIFILPALKKEDGFIYVIVEHKSYPDLWAASQMLGYIVELWRRHKRMSPSGTPLPRVLPLIFTQVETKQSNACVDLKSVTGPLCDELSKLQPRFRLSPIYLGRAELLATLCGLYWATSWMLANSRKAQHIKDKATLEALGECLYSIPYDSYDESLLPQLLAYINATFKPASRRVIMKTLKELLNGFEPEPGSYADLMRQWREEGGPERVMAMQREEGREEGVEEGIDIGVEKGIDTGRQMLLKLAGSRVSEEEMMRLRAIEDIEDLTAEVDKLL